MFNYLAVSFEPSETGFYDKFLKNLRFVAEILLLEADS